MKLTSNMRFTVLCIAASVVSASYEGFFGKPTSDIESNEKTRRLEHQLRKSLGESKPISGPRGADVGSKETAKEDPERNLAYYGYYDPSPYYYEEPEYDHYYYEDPYYVSPKKQAAPYKKYPKYHYPSKKSKKMKSMKWGGKMKGSKNKWQGKWQSKWQKKYPVPRK